MATVTDSLGRSWDPKLHPRDRKGRFIRTFRSVKLFDINGIFGWATGTVDSISDENHVNITITDVSKSHSKKGVEVGQKVTLPSNQLESIPEKARLDHKGAPQYLKDWSNESLGAPNAAISSYAASIGFNKEERAQINDVLNGKNGKYPAGKYAVALYALNRSYSEKHLSGKSEQTPDGQKNFIETLDWLGVPDDITDNTPDGKSGLDELLKEYNASKAEGQPKDLLPRIASREIEIDGSRIGLEESLDPHRATHFYAVEGTGDNPSMTKIEGAEHNPTVEDLDFDTVKATLKGTNTTPSPDSEAPTPETDQTDTPEVPTPEETPVPEPATPDEPTDTEPGDIDENGNPVFRVLPQNERGKSGDGHTKADHWGIYGASGGFIAATDPQTGEKKYLLFKSKVGSKVQGKWILPGGAKEELETPEQGFARELQEELKVPDTTMSGFKLKGKSIYTDSKDKDWEYQNIAVESPEMFTPDLDTPEAEDAKWFSEDEIANLVAKGEVYDKLAPHLAELFKQHKGETQQITEAELPGDEIPEFDLFPEIEKPLDISGWTSKGSAGGSNGARIMVDEDGETWYVKKPKSKDVAQSEYLANKFYEELGIPVPEQHPAVDEHGDSYLASKAVAQTKGTVDFKTLMNKLNKGTPLDNDEEAALASIHDGFLADVFLDNYDVKGADGWEDNILIDEDGIAYRVDNGSALLYSATGKEKKPTGNNSHYRFFDDKDLIKGFLTGFQGGLSINTDKLFAGVTEDQKKSQAENLKSLDDKTIDRLVDSTTLSDAKKNTVRTTLKKRRDLILSEVAASGTKTDEPTPEPDAPEVKTPDAEPTPDTPAEPTPPADAPTGGDEPPTGGDNTSLIQAAKDADPFFEEVKLANGDRMALTDQDSGYSKYQIQDSTGKIKFNISVVSTASAEEIANEIELGQAKYDKEGPTPYVDLQNKLKGNTTTTKVDEPTPDAPQETETPDEPTPTNPNNAEFPKTEPVALEGEAFPPTREQQDIIDAVTAGHDTKVLAGAGSGKTSTVVALAKRLKDKKILYVAFNKSVQLEAEERMPGNVEPRTGHSLAHAWSKVNAPFLLKKMNDKNNQISNGKDVADYLGIDNADFAGIDRTDVARGVLDTVAKYATSADDDVLDSHLSDEFKDSTPEIRAKVLELSKKAWTDIADNPDGKLKVTHDAYRKKWALSKPDLSNGQGGNKKADIVIIDEAQDTPPVLAKVIADQNMQKVVVGDENQAIYGFTGAVDYLSEAEADVDLPLTKSWRFGAGIADAGNRALQMLGAKMRIIGGGKESTIGEIDEPDAILTRTNGGMLNQIIDQIDKGRTVGVPAGTKNDLVKLILSAFKLKTKQNQSKSQMHDDIAPYNSWGELLAAAEKGDVKAGMVKNILENHDIAELNEYLDKVIDGDGVNSNENLARLKAKISPNGSAHLETPFEPANNKKFDNAWDMVLKAGLKDDGWGIGDTGQLYVQGPKKGTSKTGVIYKGTDDPQQALKNAMEKINAVYGGEVLSPDVTISTAHKAKGLEWEKVRIGDDFKGPQTDANGNSVNPPDEELKLAYVALTRAKTHLDPGSLSYIYDNTDENGGVPDNTPDAPDLAPDDLKGKTEAAKEKLTDKKRADVADEVDPPVSLAPDDFDDDVYIPDQDPDQPLADWEKELLGLNDKTSEEDLPETPDTDTSGQNIADLHEEIKNLDPNDTDYFTKVNSILNQIQDIKDKDSQDQNGYEPPPSSTDVLDEPTLTGPNGESDEFLKLAQAYYKKGGSADLNKDQLQQIVQLEYTLKDLPEGTTLEDFLPSDNENPKLTNALALMVDDQGPYRYFSSGPEAGTKMRIGTYVSKRFKNGKTYHGPIIHMPTHSQPNVHIGKLNPDGSPMIDENGHWEVAMIHIGEVRKHYGFNDNGSLKDGPDGEYSSPFLYEGYKGLSAPESNKFYFVQGKPKAEEKVELAPGDDPNWQQQLNDAIFGQPEDQHPLPGGYSMVKHVDGLHATVEVFDPEGNSIDKGLSDTDLIKMTVNDHWNKSKEVPEPEAPRTSDITPDEALIQLKIKLANNGDVISLPNGYKATKTASTNSNKDFGENSVLLVTDKDGTNLGTFENMKDLKDVLAASDAVDNSTEETPKQQFTSFQAFHKAYADKEVHEDFDGYTYDGTGPEKSVAISTDTGEFVGNAKTDKQAEKMAADEKVIQEARETFANATPGTRLFFSDNSFLESNGGGTAEADFYNAQGQFQFHYDLSNLANRAHLRQKKAAEYKVPSAPSPDPTPPPLTEAQVLAQIPMTPDGKVDLESISGKEFGEYVFSVDEDGFSQNVNIYWDDPSDPYGDLEYVTSGSVFPDMTPYDLIEAFKEDGFKFNEPDNGSTPAVAENESPYSKQDFIGSIPTNSVGNVSMHYGQAWEFPDGSTVSIDEDAQGQLIAGYTDTDGNTSFFDVPETVTPEDFINDLEFASGIKLQDNPDSEQSPIDDIPTNSDGTVALKTGTEIKLPNGSKLFVDDQSDGLSTANLTLTDGNGEFISDEIYGKKGLTPAEFIKDIEDTYGLDFSAQSTNDNKESEHKDSNGNSLFEGDTVINNKTGKPVVIHSFTKGFVRWEGENGKLERISKKFVTKDVPAKPAVELKPDPNSPLYNAPEPQKPEPSELLDESPTEVLGDDWFKKVEQHWLATKTGPKTDLKESQRYAHYIGVMHGSAEELEFVKNKNWLSPELYDEAKTAVDSHQSELAEKMQKKAEALADYQQKLADYRDAYVEWAIANGKPVHLLKGMSGADVVDFTKLSESEGHAFTDKAFDNGLKSKLSGFLNSISLYKGDSWSVNKTAHSGSGSASGKATFKKLLEAMKVAPKLEQDTIFLRTIGADSLYDPATGKKYPHENISFDEAEALAKRLTGTIGVNEGFSGSNNLPTPHYGSGRTLWMNIRVPAGTPYIPTDSNNNNIGSFHGEYETILPAGMHFYVHGYEVITYHGSKKIILKVEVVPDDVATANGGIGAVTAPIAGAETIVPGGGSAV